MAFRSFQTSILVLVIAVIGMGVVVNTAGAVVDNVGRYNENYCEREKPKLVIVPYLFGNQQYNAYAKYNGRQIAMMMFPVAMPKGIHSNHKGDKDHRVFQQYILNDIDAKNRQAGKQKR